MANIGYIRAASKKDAEEKKNDFSSCGIKRYFIDIQDERSRERKQLQEMLSYIRDDDVVFVSSIYELADSLSQLLDLMSEIHIRGADILSLTEPVINTTAAEGGNLFAVLELLKSFKKTTLKRRQAEGIAVAVADKKYKGRIRKDFNHGLFTSLYNMWKNKQVSKDEMCRKLGVSLSTLDRRISEYRKEHSDKKEAENGKRNIKKS